MKRYIIIGKNVGTTALITSIVNGFEGISFLGNADNESDALGLVFAKNPDIVFLDMDGTITDVSGFLLDIAQHNKKRPAFIGLSSFKKSAYKAFRYDFFDFLLSPVKEPDLQRSILKYQKKHFSKMCQTACSKFSESETICLRSNKDYRYLNTHEILFLKADNNTTDFYMKDGSLVGAYKTLKTFENKLPENFLRIHKSYIINSRCISRIHYGKSVCIITDTSYRIPFTKTFIRNINAINTALTNSAFITLF